MVCVYGNMFFYTLKTEVQKVLLLARKRMNGDSTLEFFHFSF
jgi:hypothetical protein